MFCLLNQLLNFTRFYIESFEWLHITLVDPLPNLKQIGNVLGIFFHIIDFQEER